MWLQFRANFAGRYIEMRMRRVHSSMCTEGIKAFLKRMRRCSVDGRKQLTLETTGNNDSHVSRMRNWEHWGNTRDPWMFLKNASSFCQRLLKLTGQRSVPGSRVLFWKCQPDFFYFFFYNNNFICNNTRETILTILTILYSTYNKNTSITLFGLLTALTLFT